MDDPLDAVPALETLISVYGHLGVSATPAVVGAPYTSAAAAAAGSSSSSSNNQHLEQPLYTKSISSSSLEESSYPQPPPLPVTAYSSSSSTSSSSVAQGSSFVAHSQGDKRQRLTPPTSKAGKRSSSSRSKSIKKRDAEDEEDEEEDHDGDADDVEDGTRSASSKEKTRFRWTDELHQYFLACVFELGLEMASPKKIFDKMMGDPEFAKSLLDEDMLNVVFNPNTSKQFGAHHVKSHLQRFRANVVNPRAAFVKQVAELMDEAKRKRKEEGRGSKVLNPEYHAYPFTVEKPFPSNTTIVKPSAASTTRLPPPPPMQTLDTVADTSSALSAAALLRPRGYSTIEAGEQMRAQVEMRERIESHVHRQLTLTQIQEDEFFGIPPGGLGVDDDDDFDWLIGSDA